MDSDDFCDPIWIVEHQLGLSFDFFSLLLFKRIRYYQG